MIQKVQIRVVNPKVEDDNPATGEKRKRQDIVVAWTEQRPDGSQKDQLIITTLYNEQQKLFEDCQYKVGDTLEMDINFSTRLGGDGKVYNSIRTAICR